jgi:Mg-chelatase subunit ChlI
VTREVAVSTGSQRLRLPLSSSNSGEETREGPASVATTARNNQQGAYPFAGIVGMADLKLALLLNAVSPAIGGVLVRGEKGTAKSTMVRGLAALLPPVPVVPGCPYSRSEPPRTG